MIHTLDKSHSTKICVSGGMNKRYFNMLMDVYHLKSLKPERITTPKIARYKKKTYKDLKEDADFADDEELLQMTKVE